MRTHCSPEQPRFSLVPSPPFLARLPIRDSRLDLGGRAPSRAEVKDQR